MITPVARASAGITAPSKALLLGLLLALITTACGNRGPLYLPDEAPPPAAAASDPDSGEAAPGAREAEEETQDDAFGHEGDEED